MITLWPIYFRDIYAATIKRWIVWRFSSCRAGWRCVYIFAHLPGLFPRQLLFSPAASCIIHASDDKYIGSPSPCASKVTLFLFPDTVPAEILVR